MASSSSLKIVIVGHVDHGKSTLIGRLFYDTGTFSGERYAEIERSSAGSGRPFEFAFLVDALEEERQHGITIDTTQTVFRSSRRDYVIIDAPGHKEFLKNMVTGASGADAAILLVDATEGVREQTRRHAYVLSLLGLEKVVVAVNKLDRLDYAQEAFETLSRQVGELLQSIGIRPRLTVPLSAREGDNVVHRSSRTPWYSGPSLLEALDQLEPAGSLSDLPLAFPIQDVYRDEHKRLYVGRVETGEVHPGMRVLFYPSRKHSVVRSVEKWGRGALDRAGPGESIGLTLEEEIFVERGEVMTAEGVHLPVSRHLEATVFWLGRSPLRLGHSYLLKLATAEVEARVASIHEKLDSSTLQAVQEGRDHVSALEVASLHLTLERPLAVQPFSVNRPLGRFVLADGGVVAGGGILRAVREEEPASGAFPGFLEIALSEADLRQLLEGNRLERDLRGSLPETRRVILFKS